MAEEEKQSKGIKNHRIHIPINGSQTIDFGFQVQNIVAFVPKNNEFNECALFLIQNGQLIPEAKEIYKGRMHYSDGKFDIRNFQQRDTTVLLFDAPNGVLQKYTIEVGKD